MKEGINVNNTNMRKECEVLWAKNKYYVLSKSHKVYLEIREYLKEKEVDVQFLKEKILNLRDIEESKKDFNNAILHVWGYFKKDASDVEKQGLLKKYPNKYLQESTLLTGEYDETLA